MKKRSLALFLALTMCLALLPTAALAKEAQVGDTTVTDEEGSYKLSNPISKVDAVPKDIEAFIRQNGSDSTKINGLYVVPTGTTITNSNPEMGISYLASDGIGEDGSVEVPAGKYIIVWGAEFHVFYGGDSAQAQPDKPVTPPSSADDFEINGKGELKKYKGGGGNVVIPGTVTRIGYRAFEGCTSLTGVTIPNSVTQIDGYAFGGCTGLSSITIPASVTSIISFAFIECSNLEEINVDPNNKEYISIDGILYTRNMSTLVVHPAKKQSAPTFSIPEGVTEIESYAFDSCTGVTTVAIPGSVTKINALAFYQSPSLTSITIPDSVTYLGQQAFQGCTGLTSVTLSKGISNISIHTFDGCTSLTSVTIPSSVTHIEGDAFSRCTSLKDVYYAGTQEQWNAIETNTYRDYRNDMTSATIHYNSTGSDQPATPDQPSNLPTVENIPAMGTAVARTQNVLLDGKTVSFQYYAVKNAQGNETNYVKLRDLAQALNGTKAQFNVGWDGKISITSNTAYQAVGGEGSTPYSGNQPYAAVSNTPVSFNGKDVNLTSFQLKDSAGNGYTYYKLRDLGQLLNFNVTWNGGVVIETDKPYSGQ